jgi:archaetidylinositol phosphate synthase
VKPDHLTALGVLAALGIAAAYVLSIGDSAWLWAASGLLVLHALGTFTLGYGRLGPTEGRLILIGVNTLLALGVVGPGLLDVFGIALAAAMLVALIGRAGRNLRRLAELEPAS